MISLPCLGSSKCRISFGKAKPKYYVTGRTINIKKRPFSPKFKTKVVLELLSGEKTLAQAAGKHDVTATGLKSRKREFLENASMAFDLRKATKSYKDDISNLRKENDALAKKLGRTTIEQDWLAGRPKTLDSFTGKGPVDSKPCGPAISMTGQCQSMAVNRSSLCHRPKPTGEADLKAMSRVDDIFTNISSTCGCRFMHRKLPEDGFKIRRNKVLRLMNRIGIQAIFPGKKKPTSIKNHAHKIHSYLGFRDIEFFKLKIKATHRARYQLCG